MHHQATEDFAVCGNTSGRTWQKSPQWAGHSWRLQRCVNRNEAIEVDEPLTLCLSNCWAWWHRVRGSLTNSSSQTSDNSMQGLPLSRLYFVYSFVATNTRPFGDICKILVRKKLFNCWTCRTRLFKNNRKTRVAEFLECCWLAAGAPTQWSHWDIGARVPLDKVPRNDTADHNIIKIGNMALGCTAWIFWTGIWPINTHISSSI